LRSTFAGSIADLPRDLVQGSLWIPTFTRVKDGGTFKKRGASVTSASSRSYLRYTE
jgi:hypothetical protein